MSSVAESLGESPVLRVRSRAPGSLWLIAAFFFCIALGLATIFESLSAGEGMWYWYAVLLRGGHHLYADMHLALQPLYILETSAWMALAGKGWFVSRVPAVLHLIAFCLALWLLVREADMSDWHRGLLLAIAFLTSISFEAYRFDDYHVLADCFGLYSILLLIYLRRSDVARRSVTICAGLGVLSGLCVMTRLNDGAALLFAVAIGIAFLARQQRLLGIAIFCAAAALTDVLIVHLTGDSYRDYLTYSILRAASSKGGAGNVLKYPLELPVDAVRRSYEYLVSGAWLILGLIVITFAVVLPRAFRRRTARDIAIAIVCLGLLILSWRIAYIILSGASFLQIIAGVLILAAYLLGIWVIARVALSLSNARLKKPNTLLVLVFIPLGQLASASLSSGGSYLGLYGPLAVTILVIAIAQRYKTTQGQRDFLTAMAILLVISTACARIRSPFSWHTYHSQPLYAQRTVYRSPAYGRMIIEPELLGMIKPVCTQVDQTPSDELLSLPFPFANYFCNKVPWRGYVQTFFDTSSPATIDHLMVELNTAPPKWILYQRQLHTLSIHETIYNAGKPLEHRHLDELIMRNIENGKWQVTYASNYGNGSVFDNHWYLIRTR
jgi:hypothetical protein